MGHKTCHIHVPCLRPETCTHMCLQPFQGFLSRSHIAHCNDSLTSLNIETEEPRYNGNEHVHETLQFQYVNHVSDFSV